MADGAPFDPRTELSTPSTAEGGGHAFHPPEVWAAAREAYLDGASGPEVCARYGLKLGTFRHRAAAEGWRRADHGRGYPDEGQELEALTGGEPERIEFYDLAHVARARMMRAVLRGAAAEALRWKRVADVMIAEQTQVDRWCEEDEARAYALREAQAAERGSDGSDCSD
jgi:hypothetical protein